MYSEDTAHEYLLSLICLRKYIEPFGVGNCCGIKLWKTLITVNEVCRVHTAYGNERINKYTLHEALKTGESCCLGIGQCQVLVLGKLLHWTTLQARLVGFIHKCCWWMWQRRLPLTSNKQHSLQTPRWMWLSFTRRLQWSLGSPQQKGMNPGGYPNATGRTAGFSLQGACTEEKKWNYNVYLQTEMNCTSHDEVNFCFGTQSRGRLEGLCAVITTICSGVCPACKATPKELISIM